MGAKSLGVDLQKNGFSQSCVVLKWTCFYAVALSLLFCEDTVIGLSIAPQNQQGVAESQSQQPTPDAVSNHFELGKTFEPTGPRKLSVAGKCFLTLAFIHFFVNAMWYIITEKNARMDPAMSGKVPGMATFESIFTEESLETASNALTFVAPLAVMMLFVLFRSIDQGREVSPNSQQFYYVVVVGIAIQAADIVIHVNISGLGNISG